jgi:hypothetical protein
MCWHHQGRSEGFWCEAETREACFQGKAQLQLVLVITTLIRVTVLHHGGTAVKMLELKFPPFLYGLTHLDIFSVIRRTAPDFETLWMKYTLERATVGHADILELYGSCSHSLFRFSSTSAY